MYNSVRIVHNKLLGGWFIVKGPHQTPLGGRFNSFDQALKHLQNKGAAAKMHHAVAAAQSKGLEWSMQ